MGIPIRRLDEELSPLPPLVKHIVSHRPKLFKGTVWMGGPVPVTYNPYVPYSTASKQLCLERGFAIDDLIEQNIVLGRPRLPGLEASSPEGLVTMERPFVRVAEHGHSEVIGRVKLQVGLCQKQGGTAIDYKEVPFFVTGVQYSPLVPGSNDLIRFRLYEDMGTLRNFTGSLVAHSEAILQRIQELDQK